MKKLLLATALITFPLTGALGRQITVTLDPNTTNYHFNRLYVNALHGVDYPHMQSKELHFGMPTQFDIPDGETDWTLGAQCFNVLAMHQTGAEIDISEANDYHLKLTYYKPPTNNPGDKTNPAACTFEWTAQ